MSKTEMKAKLQEMYGLICQGCFRTFDHEAYFELDHILPQSAGGDHELHNRMLLFKPCNGRKSDRFMLKELRLQNKNNMFFPKETKVHIPTKMNNDLYSLKHG